jgi:hypothetical protein
MTPIAVESALLEKIEQARKIELPKTPFYFLMNGGPMECMGR